MKTLEFIKSSIGNKVYLTNNGDLAIDPTFRDLIKNKTEFTLIGLSRGGMAIIAGDNNKELHRVPPKNVREIGN